MISKSVLKFDVTTREIEVFFYARKSNTKLIDPPRKNTTAPTVILFHDIMGLVASVYDLAEAITNEGFNVFLPNLYSNEGQFKYCVQFLMKSAVRENDCSNNKPLTEVQNLISQIKNLEYVNEKKIGVMGQCLTGGFVLHAALMEGVEAPVVFHHSFGTKGSGLPTSCSRQIKNSKKVIQGHFSKVDPLCPSKRVDQLQYELGSSLERNDYWLPHGIPHLFNTNDDDAKLAYSRMVRFFHDRLDSK